MKFADAVCMATEAQRENGHAERIEAIDLRFSEPEKVVETNAEVVRVTREMADHHFAREGVVSGRDRGMRGENV